MHSGREDVEDSDSVADLSVTAVNERPPEERRRKEEADVHERMDPVVFDGRLEESRQVPDPQSGAVEDPHGERPGESPPRAGHRRPPGPAPDRASPGCR